MNSASILFKVICSTEVTHTNQPTDCREKSALKHVYKLDQCVEVGKVNGFYSSCQHQPYFLNEMQYWLVPEPTSASRVPNLLAFNALSNNENGLYPQCNSTLFLISLRVDMTMTSRATLRRFSSFSLFFLRMSQSFRRAGQ